MIILKGHVSKETAYLVTDYPYGFRLRCSIRYWLEHKKGKGIRFCSQTTNPKKDGVVWNKEKCSTYVNIAGAMYLDEIGHVVWSGLSQYSTLAESLAWNEKFREGVQQEALQGLDGWIEAKKIYEAKLSAGMDYRQAGIETATEIMKGG